MLLKFGPGFGKIGSEMPAAAFFARQRTTSDQKGDCLDVPQFVVSPCRVAHRHVSFTASSLHSPLSLSPAALRRIPQCSHVN